MSDVSVTLRDGRTHTLDNVFIRGSQIRFLILPDMLKNAPMFKVRYIKWRQNISNYASKFPVLLRTLGVHSAVDKEWVLAELHVDEALFSGAVVAGGAVVEG